jgi:Mobilization protein NikA
VSIMSDDRRSRRGPGPLDPTDKRDHCVSVRLNDRELALLNERRGKFQRGEWLRMAALDKLPPMIPPLNQQAWAELARASANLNQIARELNFKRTPGGLQDQLAEFRAALIGAQLQGGEDEGHEPH